MTRMHDRQPKLLCRGRPWRCTRAIAGGRGLDRIGGDRAARAKSPPEAGVKSPSMDCPVSGSGCVSDLRPSRTWSTIAIGSSDASICLEIRAMRTAVRVMLSTSSCPGRRKQVQLREIWLEICGDIDANASLSAAMVHRSRIMVRASRRPTWHSEATAYSRPGLDIGHGTVNASTATRSRLEILTYGHCVRRPTSIDPDRDLHEGDTGGL